MTSFKQKLNAILVLSLFILSVLPAGLADKGSSSLIEVEVNAKAEVESDAADAEVKSKSKAKVETEENDSETEEEVEVETEEKDGEVKEEVKIKTKAKDGLLKKEAKREVKVLKNAREKLEEAKEQYKKAKENQREHRLKILELNKLVKRCNPEKEDCSVLKAELRLGVKNHLLKSVQVVEQSLEKLTKTIEKMEDLSEEEKKFALGLVADLEAELDAQKAEIGSFTNETSPEEIRTAIKGLKELNQKVHKMQRRLVGLLVNAKLNVLVEKQTEFHTSMQTRIDVLAETGADVSELEAILAEFDAKVAELEQDYENAQEKWMETKDAEDLDFDEFNRVLRKAQLEVRKDLQEIKKILREFLQEYKELKEDLSEENEAGEEQEKAEEAENESEEASEDENESNGQVESNTSIEANASAENTA